MRITGGIARGIPLKVFDKSTVRPATDFLREAVFSSIAPLVSNATFLDLFAGTGAYGLEALSRGAKTGAFIEKKRRLIPILEENLAAVEKSLATPTHATIYCTDAFKYTLPKDIAFDLIFADPPYALVRQSLDVLIARLAAWLTPSIESRLILEIPGDLPLPDYPKLKILRRLGKRSKGSPSAVIFQISGTIFENCT